MTRAGFWHGFGCGLSFLALLLAAIYREHTAAWLAVSVVWALVAGLAYMIGTAEDEPEPWDFGA